MFTLILKYTTNIYKARHEKNQYK